ncbi:MAG: hypothetical protein IPJ89_00510 [Candidatus Iainarchaeum archaeon]|uniref:DUF6884 domain-containing protein n=1 Tax=Candidatus Iainarchaeum sp. TaxID=3101447 RepID=A0A7T9DJX6_9ARCH|nr:MAG: hypothetical protein IPJ89_00510 [Candidatus Diapherotrites archaeon]
MRTIYLIGCVKKKATIPSIARQLYISPLFKLSLRYAEKQKPDAIYILSAMHGVMELNQTIAPYNQTLLGKKVTELHAWGARVKAQLEAKADLKKDQFIFLAGNNYQSALRPHLTHWNDPLAGLGLGKRLHWLKEHTTHD